MRKRLAGTLAPPALGWCIAPKDIRVPVMLIGDLDSALFRGPDEFVELGLETHGQGISDDAFDQLQSRDGRLAGGNFFQRFILLLGCEGVHPGNEQWANGSEVVFRDLLFHPGVIFHGADDEFDFVGAFQVRQVFPAIAFGLTAAGTFEIHDAADAGVHGGDVMRAAGFEQDGVAGVAEFPHERQGVFLEERFAAR